MPRRAFDVVVAAAGLLVAAPLLAAMLAVVIETRGGAFYRQRRVGLHGREFEVLKLRTMVQGAEHVGAGMAVNTGDAASRASAGSCAARRSTSCPTSSTSSGARWRSSARGRRCPSQVAQYTERERGRLAVRPGLTGWAQVNGRTALPWSERIELDLWYIEHRTWRLDLKILWRSARLVVRGEGLYKGETGGWTPRG